MLERDLFCIEEIQYAIAHIEEYVQDISTIEGLQEDSKTYDAVLMNFIIIGEAANRMSESFKESLPNIDWRAIKGFRNFVAHEYFGVDVNIIWSAIHSNLPELKTQLGKQS
jgi:uncharacterized protein with HEPN domain